MWGRFEDYGDSTRSVSAVAREHVAGQPMQLGPIFAAPYQLSADEGSESDTYARASNPGWRGLESALAALERADHALVMGSGMSAITATLRSVPRRGGYRRRALGRVLPSAVVRERAPRAVGNHRSRGFDSADGRRELRRSARRVTGPRGSSSPRHRPTRCWTWSTFACSPTCATVRVRC